MMLGNGLSHSGTFTCKTTQISLIYASISSKNPFSELTLIKKEKMKILKKTNNNQDQD